MATFERPHQYARGRAHRDRQRCGDLRERTDDARAARAGAARAGVWAEQRQEARAGASVEGGSGMLARGEARAIADAVSRAERRCQSMCPMNPCPLLVLPLSSPWPWPPWSGRRPTRRATRRRWWCRRTRIASQVGVAVLREGGNADRRRRRDRLRAGRRASDGRQHRRRRVHRVSSGRRASRWPTTSARWRRPESHPSMFLKDGKYDATLAPRQLPVGRRARAPWPVCTWRGRSTARCRGRASSSRPSPWRATDSRCPRGWPVRSRACCRRCRRIRRRWRSSRRTACRTRPGRSGSSRTWPVRSTRIAERGPAGFYEGETAALLAKDMAAHGGLITEADLKAYTPERRVPIRGTYRGYDVLSMPPISSGGTALIQMLNILEGFDLAANGWGSARNIHLIAEVDAARVRRSRAVPRRPGVQPADAHRAPDLEGLRRDAASGRFASTARRPRRPRASSGRTNPTRPRTCPSSTRRAARCR